MNNLRNLFIKYFESKNHKYIKNSSIISNYNDLLFVNSGMSNFKSFFYNNNNIYTKNIVNSQLCLRVGGKHNDINNIGFTNKHSTIFEMLGNFSFGDYFKEECIFMAFEFLTDKNYLNFKKDKLIITIYYNDYESEKIWKKVGINNNNIIKIKDKNNIKYNSENFWEISFLGLCGTSSEIYYDLGDNNEGNYPGFGDTGNRYLEIWNLVFIQFYKNIDKKIINLKYNSIDTGMGLERVLTIIQKLNSNYDLYIYRELIESTFNILKIKNKFDNINSIRIIVDHIKTSIFIINENIIPSNEKHGYVLRKIIRRAYCHIKSFNINKPILHKLVKSYFNIIIKFYNFLNINKIKYIENIILLEEIKFIDIINNGIYRFKKELNKTNKINNSFINKLYDTYGLPIEIINDYCKINKINIEYTK